MPVFVCQGLGGVFARLNAGGHGCPADEPAAWCMLGRGRCWLGFFPSEGQPEGPAIAAAVGL